MEGLANLAGRHEMVLAIELVEKQLRIEASSHHPLISEKLQHLVGAGGKRIRPLVTLASAMTSVEDAALATDVLQQSVKAAVITEMIHVGSLYHDDVMDDADQRRGVVSPNAKWGNLVAILSGDFLLARASELATTLGEEVSTTLARALRQLVHGQLLEFEHAHNRQRTVDEYYEAIRGKTASLFSAACFIGAIVAGAPKEQAESLAVYGDSIGMAFQICDDISDIISSTRLLGKPAGTDVERGNYTLPVLLALKDAESAAIINDLLDRGGHELQRFPELMRTTGGIDMAISAAKDFTECAIGSLALVPDSDVAAQLVLVAAELVDSLVPIES